MRRGGWACAGSLALLLASTSPASTREPRPPEEPGRPARREAPEDGATDLSGRPRRGLEGVRGARTADELTRQEAPVELVWRQGGCAIDGEPAFVKALLGLQNESDLMSLELWGDTHEYRPYQRVMYYLRVPRQAYVTVFWIGPKHDVFMPFTNLRVPADRDVSVDPDSIVVPPLGREQWVGVATLEPVVFDCYGPESTHVAWVGRVKAVPHGVGRWEVRSRAP